MPCQPGENDLEGGTKSGGDEMEGVDTMEVQGILAGTN